MFRAPSMVSESISEDSFSGATILSAVYASEGIVPDHFTTKIGQPTIIKIFVEQAPG